MEKYSKKAESFINNYVLSKLGYDSISDDNIVEIREPTSPTTKNALGTYIREK